MQTISRQKAQEFVQNRDDVAVIEVLDEKNFEKFHLPGARNVPLDENFTEKIEQAVPDKKTPVMVYCLDSECSASPKAAQQMEEIGYTDVYDYEAGKVDWREAGLPVEQSA